MKPIWIGFFIGMFVGCSIGAIVIGLLLGGENDVRVCTDRSDVPGIGGGTFGAGGGGQ
jgi:hypothetical protein